MCIYCTTNKYRKIYENHFGKIPREANGRTYEIHHIDGNHDNNHYSNLIAVSLQEHYEIHKKQGDFWAAKRLAEKLKLSPEIISELASQSNYKRVNDGTHPFVGGHIQNQRVNDGTHPFVGGHIQNQRVKDGTHNWLGKDNPVHKLIADKTHPLLGGKIQQKTANERSKAGLLPAQIESKEGRHRWTGGKLQKQMAKEGRLSVQIQCCCLVCKEQTNISALGRRHGENCGKNAIIVNGIKYLTKKKACDMLGLTMYALNKILKNE